MPPIKQNKGAKKKKRVKIIKKNVKNDKISILNKQLVQVQEEVLQLEQQARVLCTSVVRCENKLFPFMDPTNIQNMSMDDYENAHSELQEMLFDCRQIMDKITHEKNNLLELIDSLGLLEEDKSDLLKSLQQY